MTKRVHVHAVETLAHHKSKKYFAATAGLDSQMLHHNKFATSHADVILTSHKLLTSSSCWKASG